MLLCEREQARICTHAAEHDGVCAGGAHRIERGCEGRWPVGSGIDEDIGIFGDRIAGEVRDTHAGRPVMTSGRISTGRPPSRTTATCSRSRPRLMKCRTQMRIAA